MKVSDLWSSHVPAGRLVEWRLSVPAQVADGGAGDGRPPAYIQEAHLRTARDLAARGLSAPSWVGTAFDIPGRVEEEALGRVLRRWTVRHETLRSGFRWEGAELRRFTLAPDEVVLSRSDRGHHADPAEVCRLLQDAFDTATNALKWPNFLYAAVLGEESTRLYLAFDHTNVDAYSLQLMAAQIHELHAAETGGAAAAPAPFESYVDFCEIERARADEVDADDEVVRRWRDFIAGSGGTLPSFPLDMGVTPGDLPEQAFWSEMLVDAELAAGFDHVCRPFGGVLPGLLAASAVVVQEAGGPSTYRTVVPFHTRATSRWGVSVGWYVGAVPVEVPTGQARDFREVLGLARAALRSNRAMARLPVARVLRLLEADFRPPSPDLFSLLSYVDGRTTPGAESWEAWDATTLLRVSHGDQVCVWVTRTRDGLQFASRHPITPEAYKNLARYVEGMRAVITSVARAGSYGG